MPDRRVPRLRPTAGPLLERAHARSRSRPSSASIRSRCGAATCCPTRPGRGSRGGGARIDVGALGPHLDALLDAFDYAGWRARQAEARADGRLVGIGVSTLVQGTAPTQYGVAGRFGSYECAAVGVLPDGRVTVAVGTKSQGQSHETTLAQVAADVLGVGVERVTVTDGDTAALPYGMGSWGSRTAVMAGGAVLTAATPAAREDGSHRARAWQRRRAPRRRSSRSRKRRGGRRTGSPPGEEPGLHETVVYTPGNTMPVPDANGHMNFDETFGAHMTAVAVEVDPETGDVHVLDAVLVSDCGVVINPMVVEGQHQGGFAQGLGAVLLEEIRYDDAGSAAHVDARRLHDPRPRTDVPPLRVVHRETPSAIEGGFRGVGEAAIIAAPAVIAGAVADALAPLGVAITSTRLHAHVPARRDPRRGYDPDAAAFASADASARGTGAAGSRPGRAAAIARDVEPGRPRRSRPGSRRRPRRTRPASTARSARGPASGSCTPTRSTVRMSHAARSACIPGASDAEIVAARGTAADPRVAMRSSSRADGQRVGIVGLGAAVRERGDAQVAEQVGAVVRRAPGGAEARA